MKPRVPVTADYQLVCSRASGHQGEHYDPLSMTVEGTHMTAPARRGIDPYADDWYADRPVPVDALLPIRPSNPEVSTRSFQRGQVWVVDDQPGVRWFVLDEDRVIALFAGGADHTPRSLYHTYGERLRLEAVATVFASCRNCTRKGCGKPLAEHELGVFCP